MGREQHVGTPGSCGLLPIRTACGLHLAKFTLLAFALALALVSRSNFSASAQISDTVSEQLEDPDASTDVSPAEDPKAPRRHFRIRDPAQLSDGEAARIYAQLKARMTAGYALSRLPQINGYQRWMRLNRVPYRSASHGQRYLNNYANEKARAYARFERSGTLPVGAIIAKDSITVRGDGSAMPGALFLMEKMPDGFNHVSGNWRYTMIMPDGSVFGTTGGAGAKQVQFCISCHLAVEHQDHLFFIPKEYRHLSAANGR